MKQILEIYKPHLYSSNVNNYHYISFYLESGMQLHITIPA